MVVPSSGPLPNGAVCAATTPCTRKPGPVWPSTRKRRTPVPEDINMKLHDHFGRGENTVMRTFPKIQRGAVSS